MMNNELAVNENIGVKPLSLEPKIHDKIKRFLKNEKDIFDLVDAFGSPLNLMFPQIIDENINGFTNIYEKHNIQGEVFFSTKPNKSISAMRQASCTGSCIDVSSEEGLKVALACGFSADCIEATGPKNLQYLTLALQHGIILNVDNFEELDQIISIRKALNTKMPTNVFVRLTGFEAKRMKFTSHDSTFGIHVHQTPEVIDYLKAHKDTFNFLGFSFHFNSKVIEQKIVALENMLQATLSAMKQGLNPKGINIGGGFDISYVADKAAWKQYVLSLKESLKTQKSSFTWNNGGLGFRNDNGLIKGAPAFLDHGPDVSGVDEFDALLELKLPDFNNQSFANILQDCLLELYIEPGRAIYDQLGVTIGRVNHVKTSAQGETLVDLDMNRSNLNSAQQKLLTDPVILYQDKSKCRRCPEGVYYMGNLCLSYDMITYNKTFPDHLPEQGDLVIFINTAPYIMDFVESNTLYQKIAKKVSIVETKDRFRWFEDEAYDPVSFTLKKVLSDDR